VDNGSQQQGNASTINISVPQTNAGTLTACGTSTEQFIDYTLDGVNYSISTTVTGDSLTAFTRADSVQGYYSYFDGLQIGGPNNITIRFKHANLLTGTYPVNELTVQGYQNTTIVTPFNIVLTKFPAAAGQFYEGSFTGSFKDTNNVTHNLNGTFKLRRIF
jgi:hypothetical protein